jgi:hypothetical protein
MSIIVGEYSPLIYSHLEFHDYVSFGNFPYIIEKGLNVEGISEIESKSTVLISQSN